VLSQGLLADGSKAVIITSQAGSVEWRLTQNAGKVLPYPINS
jgi:hypothetical protein